MFDAAAGSLPGPWTGAVLELHQDAPEVSPAKAGQSGEKYADVAPWYLVILITLVKVLINVKTQLFKSRVDSGL